MEFDSPVERAGIRVGTFIVSVDDAPTPELESLYDALVGVRAGQKLAVKVTQTGGGIESVTVEVVLRR